jgi:hypothetical protein
LKDLFFEGEVVVGFFELLARLYISKWDEIQEE